MRCSRLLTMVSVSLAVFATATTAAAQDAPRTIRVSGQAEVLVVPDEVILTLGIETRANTLQAAKEDNDQRLAALKVVAKKHGVSSQDLKADYLEVKPVYRDEYAVAPQLVHYRARRSIVVTLRDLSRFESLLSAALDAGTNYVHGTDFRTTELLKHRDAARAAALKAAVNKAHAMAASLGAQVGAPRQVDEGYMSYFSSSSWWGGRRGDATSQVSVAVPSELADSPVVPGQIAVMANVNVTFDLR